MKILSSLLVFFMLFSCSSDDPYDKLTKLTGLWQMEAPDGNSRYEEWSKSENGVMYGKGYYMNGTDSIVEERISLKKSGENIYYVPMVTGQNNGQPISFMLVEHSDTSFTFENKVHDFPRRITYRFVTRDSIIARLEGIEKGEERYWEFNLRRIFK